jgi:hypothetical protein
VDTVTDPADKSGPRKGIAAAVFDNKTQIGLSVAIALLGLAFYGGKQVQKADGEKNSVDGQMDAMRAEFKAGNEAIKVQVENFSKTMDLRATMRDKEMEAIYKRLDKHDVLLEQLMTISIKHDLVK